MSGEQTGELLQSRGQDMERQLDWEALRRREMAEAAEALLERNAWLEARVQEV